MSPTVMERLGNCGGPVPGGHRLPLLPILTQEDGEEDPNTVETCPVAMAAHDPDVRHWAKLVPSSRGQGLMHGIPDVSLPPLYRQLRDMSMAWFLAWRELKVPRA